MSCRKDFIWMQERSGRCESKVYPPARQRMGAKTIPIPAPQARQQHDWQPIRAHGSRRLKEYIVRNLKMQTWIRLRTLSPSETVHCCAIAAANTADTAMIARIIDEYYVKR